MEKKKKKRSPLPILFFLIFVALGAGMGYLLGRFTGEHGLMHSISRSGPGGTLGDILLFLLLTVLSIYLQLILHEGGHLVFGLLTGYRFVSFRIGSLMLLRSKAGFRWKRLSLAGTAGQCLMAPPEPKDGRFPFVLYNLGGSLMNLITALVFLGLFFLSRDGKYLPAFLLSLALFGLVFAITNGVPLKTPMVSNDGCNALSLGKDLTALRAFWVQLKVNEAQMNNSRLKELPEEWFSLPADADLQNPMISTVAVLRENRLMDLQDFEGAEALIRELLSDSCTLVGLYRHLLTLDLVYLDLLRRGTEADLSPLKEKDLAAFLRQMKRFPSVLRTLYGAALAAGEEKNAAEILTRFEQIGAAYPAAGEYASERELVALAAQKLAR